MSYICHTDIGFQRCTKLHINTDSLPVIQVFHQTSIHSSHITAYTYIKQGLQKYCETAYSRSGINQMWILKNSKELFEHFKSPTFNHVTSIKSFDFSTLYTTIPHQKLKNRLTSIIQSAFIFKNGNCRYKYLVLGHEETYFVQEHSDSIKQVLWRWHHQDAWISSWQYFRAFAGKVSQQTVGIPMGTKSPSSRQHLSVFIRSGCHTLFALNGKETLSTSVQSNRYINDVLSINNPEFENYLGQMYLAEHEIKDTTGSTTSASYLDLLLSIGRDGQSHTFIYDKRDDFNFHITKFPFLSRNIPYSPAYGVLSLNLYDTPWLAPRMNVSFWGPDDFPVSYATGIPRGTLEIIIQVLWSIRGPYSAIWSLPLTNVKWHSDNWPTVTFQPIRLSTHFMTLIPNLTFSELWVVSMEHLQRVWHASRERLPFQSPPSTFFGLACAPIVETILLELAISILDFHLEYPLVLSRFCSFS